MNKRTLTMIISVILFLLLLALYFYVDNKTTKVDQPEEEVNVVEDKILLIDRASDELVRMTCKTGESTLALTKEHDAGTGFILEGDGTIPLDESAVSRMEAALTQLDAKEKVNTENQDLKEFGLNPAKAEAVGYYTDGTNQKIFVGDMTASKDFYYIQIEGDENVYLVYSNVGKSLCSTLNDIIDKSLPGLDPEGIVYGLIKQKDKRTIEFKYTEPVTDEEQQMAAAGIDTMSMEQPFKGKGFNFYNFSQDVLAGLAYMTLDKIIEVNPASLARYGLDNPELELAFWDEAYQYHILAGNSIDDENVYLMIEGRNVVYAAKKKWLNGFYNIDPLKYINRFIALVNIAKAKKINIKTIQNEKYEIIINKKEIPLTEEEKTVGKEAGEVEYHPTINGKEIEEADFKKGYQMIIGLSFDSEAENFSKPVDQPELTLSYELEKKSIVINFYEYNKDFYAIESDGVIEFVINKQSVERMLHSVKDLYSKE